MNEPETAPLLACLSAALVLRRDAQSRSLFQELRTGGCDREIVREAILQLYLFDGYPTSLEALLLCDEVWPGEPAPCETGEYSDWTAWSARGLDLYNRIYGDAAAGLQDRTRRLSPELADWMIVEGYGKVLSRGGLDPASRELAIVAVLAVKERPRQLYGHLRGALRVGVKKEDLEALLDLLALRLSPPGIDEARTLLSRLSL